MTALTLRSLSLAVEMPSPSGPCFGAAYAPCYVRDGDTEYLALQGGRIDDGAGDLPIGDPKRISDKMWISQRAFGIDAWGAPQLALSGTAWPHMLDADYLRAHPESAIGSIAGPQIVKRGDVFRAVFAASYNDLGLETGEHFGHPEGKPWPMFALYMAQSTDGMKWSLVNFLRDQSNVALRSALAYFDAQSADYRGGLKGFAMPHSFIEHEGANYFFAEFWTATAQRNTLLRYGPKSPTQPGESEWGLQVYNGSGWDEITNGSIPRAYAEGVWPGNPYAHVISHVARTHAFPGYRYILLAQGAGFVYGGKGNNNCVEYALSNDLLSWTPAQMIASDIPTLNGKGADNIALNPHYAEIGGKPWLFIGTSDRNLDGVPDCASHGNEYYGIGVMSGELEVKP